MSKKTGKTIKCQHCKKDVYKSNAKLKRNKLNFCSKKCFDEYRLKRILVKCQVCGKEEMRVRCRVIRAKKYIFCSMGCQAIGYKGINHSGFFKKGATGEKCINYKQGEQEANGYIMVLSHDHPHKNKKGYVYKHRLVMEEKIGRYLTPKEVVHHIDKNKKNNDIDNLMLFENDREHHKFHQEIKELL